MKRCPKCSIEYFDHTLEFCLEDGMRLVSARSFETETPTVTKSNKPNPSTEKTVNLPFSNPAKTLELGGANDLQTIPQTDLLKERVAQQSNKVLEIAPIIIALAHNWWQWIYLNNQYYSSLSSYVLSANFLMWLLLLTASAAVSLLSLKRCKDKRLAFASLVILSINLILFLVPRR
jgi:hypothetical protein